MRARPTILSICLLLGAAVLVAQPGAASLTAADADRFAEKYNRLLQGVGTAGKARAPVAITVTEQEVNAFLRLRGQPLLPAGVIDPYVSAVGEGRLQGWATVDLDAVRQSKERGVLDPMRMLRGRVPVTAVGVLHAQGGSARFDLESASVSGIPIPKSMLQELVTYYTRGDTYPQGVNLDAPVPLPAGIREITVHSGRAVIVQ